MELEPNTAGTYILVDHSITRAFNKGALAQLKVTGTEVKDVYSGKLSDEVYLPEGAAMRTVVNAPQVPPARTREERFAHGQTVYLRNCAACHQLDGKGVPAAFPPLAASDFLGADVPRAIRTVTGGLTGRVTVNGQAYDGVMPAWDLPDEDVAAVLTYVLGAWGNAGHDVTPAEVAKHRVKPAPPTGGAP